MTIKMMNQIVEKKLIDLLPWEKSEAWISNPRAPTCYYRFRIENCLLETRGGKDEELLSLFQIGSSGDFVSDRDLILSLPVKSFYENINTVTCAEEIKYIIKAEIAIGLALKQSKE